MLMVLECEVEMPRGVARMVVTRMGKKILEMWGGIMAITTACVAAGFDGMAKEVFDEKGNLQQEANLLRLEVIADVEAEITGGKVFGTWLAPPCKTWGFFGALNGCSRTAKMPEGNNETDYELEGTLNMGVALYLFALCIMHRVHAILEQPVNSKAFLLEAVLRMLGLPEEVVRVVTYDACGWGARPSDWNSLEGDVRIRKPTGLLSYGARAGSLGRTCGDQPAHTHVAIMGKDRFGRPRSAAAAAYTERMCMLGNGDGGCLRAWGRTARGEGIRDAAIGGVDTAPSSEEVLEEAEGVQAARKGGIAASGEELSAAKVGAIFFSRVARGGGLGSHGGLSRSSEGGGANSVARNGGISVEE